MFLLALVHTVFANSMLKEMTNALELGVGEGVRDDLVSLSLHFGEDKPVVVTGRDYETYRLYDAEDLPSQIELYAGKGDDKHNILINISSARYYRMNVTKEGRDWRYDFHFYY